MAIQMTCPFCRKEFPYDNGELDRKISVKGQRLAVINKRLSEIKSLGRGKWNDETWADRRRLVAEKNRLDVEITELKAVRKTCDQQRHRIEHTLLKQLIRERYGEDEFDNLIKTVEKEIEAYKLSGLMRHEYTRANSKTKVTSINKI